MGKKEKRLSRLADWFRRRSSVSEDQLPPLSSYDSADSSPLAPPRAFPSDTGRHTYNEFRSDHASPRPPCDDFGESTASRKKTGSGLEGNGAAVTARPDAPSTHTKAGGNANSTQHTPVQSVAVNTIDTLRSRPTPSIGIDASKVVDAVPNNADTASSAPINEWLLTGGDGHEGPKPSLDSTCRASSEQSLHRSSPEFGASVRVTLPQSVGSRSSSDPPTREVAQVALRPRLRVRTTDPARPTIDYAHCPRIIITVLAAVDKTCLLRFRLTCRRHAALVNELYSAHVVIKGGAAGYAAQSALGRAPVCYDGKRRSTGRNYLGFVGRSVGVLSFEGGLRTWDGFESTEAQAAEDRLRRRLPRVSRAPVVRVADLAFVFADDVHPSTFVWFQSESHRQIAVPISTRRLVLNLCGNWRPVMDCHELALEEVIVHPGRWVREADWEFRSQCLAAVVLSLLGAEEPPRIRAVGFDPITEPCHNAMPGHKRYSLPLVRDRRINEWRRMSSAFGEEISGVLEAITFVSVAEYRANVGEMRWILETQRDAATCAAQMRALTR